MSFCNFNQHYLKNIIVTPPPPPPPPSPFSPFFFLGGGKGTGGQGTGGEPLHRPPEGGGTKSPPLLPQDFTKNFFTQGRLIWNIFLFSLSLYSLCVIYPRGRSSVHSSKLQKKLMVSSQQKKQNSLWHTSMKFIIYPPTKYH